MASNSSKALPFLVLFIVLGSLSVETYYGVDIDLEQVTVILLALGVTGGAIKAVKSASSIKAKIPDEVKIQFAKMIDEAEIRLRSTKN